MDKETSSVGKVPVIIFAVLTERVSERMNGERARESNDLIDWHALATLSASELVGVYFHLILPTQFSSNMA